MIQQIFGFLFVLTLVVPAAAVILGALSLAMPRPGHHPAHAVGTGARA